MVTDVIVAADLGPGTYRFGRWVLEIGEDLVPRGVGINCIWSARRSPWPRASII